MAAKKKVTKKKPVRRPLPPCVVCSENPADAGYSGICAECDESFADALENGGSVISWAAERACAKLHERIMRSVEATV